MCNAIIFSGIERSNKVVWKGAYAILMSLGATHAHWPERQRIVHELNFRGRYVRFDAVLDQTEELDRQAYMVLEMITDGVRR